jgi:hypothetical protein
LRRMSLDSMAGSGGPGCGIRLSLQLQGGSSSRPGSIAGSAAFARVSVPTSALQRPSPSAAAAAAAAGGECGGSDSSVGGDVRCRVQSADGGRCYDDVSDILAAVNMERDYEVRVWGSWLGSFYSRAVAVMLV